MMIIGLLLTISWSTGGLGRGVLDDLWPELTDFTSVHVRYSNEGTSVGALWKRTDNASLSVHSAVFASATERIEKVRTRRTSTSALSMPEAPNSTLHRTWSLNPLGDLIYKYDGGNSKLLDLSAGAETAHLQVQLKYLGSGSPGKIRWEVGNLPVDRLLVEDIARRVLGRMLAWQHVPSVRNGTVSASTNDLTDTAGKRFSSVSDWATNQGISATAERKVGIRFTYHGTPILVLTGADSIKVGTEWVPIGGYVMEINNKPFVPRLGFLAALP